MGNVGGTPNTVRLALFDRRTGFQPVAQTIFSLILQGFRFSIRWKSDATEPPDRDAWEDLRRRGPTFRVMPVTLMTGDAFQDDNGLDPPADRCKVLRSDSLKIITPTRNRQKYPFSLGASLPEIRLDRHRRR